MNTDMLVRQFAAENNMTIKNARKYILSLFDIIEEGIMSYGKVDIRKHICFKILDVPEKTIWSNLFNKYMKSGGYRTVQVSLHKPFRDRLNQLYERVKGHE